MQRGRRIPGARETREFLDDPAGDKRARVIDRLPKLGTLQVGAPGDVAILDLVEGPVTFVDTRNNTRSGKAYLKPIQTVTAGVPFGRPYNAPFSVR